MWHELTTHDLDCGHAIQHIEINAPHRPLEQYPGCGLTLAYDDTYHSFYIVKDGRADPNGYSCPHVQNKIRDIGMDAYNAAKEIASQVDWYVSHPLIMNYLALCNDAHLDDELDRFFQRAIDESYPGGGMSIVIRKSVNRCPGMRK